MELNETTIQGYFKRALHRVGILELSTLRVRAQKQKLQKHVKRENEIGKTLA